MVESPPFICRENETPPPVAQTSSEPAFPRAEKIPAQSGSSGARSLSPVRIGGERAASRGDLSRSPSGRQMLQTGWRRGGDSNPRCRFTFVSLKLAESGRVFRPEITINSVETMFASSSPKKLSCAAVDRDSEQRNPARGPTGRFHRFKTIALRTAG